MNPGLLYPILAGSVGLSFVLYGAWCAIRDGRARRCEARDRIELRRAAEWWADEREEVRR